MKMTFRGWKREVTTHKHNVSPVINSGNAYRTTSINGPLSWNGPMSALGKVKDLSLTGAFLIEFNFEQAELQSWLEEFAKTNPEEALRMIAPIQAEALINMSKAPKDNVEI